VLPSFVWMIFWGLRSRRKGGVTVQQSGPAPHLFQRHVQASLGQGRRNKSDRKYMHGELVLLQSLRKSPLFQKLVMKLNGPPTLGQSLAQF